MGMQRRAANTFFVESTARREVFTAPGVDGRMLDDADAKNMWDGCPGQLSVAWDMDGAVRRVKQACPVRDPDSITLSERLLGEHWPCLPGGFLWNKPRLKACLLILDRSQDTTVEASHDAGSYFCELQLYGSLAELYKRKEPAKVGFLHVPAEKGEEDITRGAEVATALITAIVEDLESKDLLAQK